MDDLIIQSYWLLFDYVKPCLLPRPTVEYTPIESTFDDIDFPYQKVITKISAYVLNFTFQGNQHSQTSWEILRKTNNYQNMINFMDNPTEMTATIARLFSELKNHSEYEVFLSVLKNMILAGKVTKDDCIKILTESGNHEALVELLQFDAGENQEGRFEL